MKPVSGIILAGGKSARMGVDKADLVLGDKTLLEIQIGKMTDMCLTDIMVSGHTGSSPHIRYIEDLIKGMGPLGGLQACFAAADCSDCLVLSVDTPLIPTDILNSLLEAHLKAGRAATILVHEGRIEPLVGVYKTALRGMIAALLRGPDRSVRALLKQIDYQTVPYTDDPALLMNCNTPEEYGELSRVWEARRHIARRSSAR